MYHRITSPGALNPLVRHLPMVGNSCLTAMASPPRPMSLYEFNGAVDGGDGNFNIGIGGMGGRGLATRASTGGTVGIS